MKAPNPRAKMFGAFLIVFFLMLSFYLYFASGAYTAGKVKKVIAPQQVIYGYSFEGLPTTKVYKDLFIQMDQLLQSNRINGTIAGLYLNKIKSKEDTIKMFVGIIPDTDKEIEGLEKYVVEEREVIQIDMNDLPKFLPNIVYPGLEKYARDNDLEISYEGILELGTFSRPDIIQVPVAH